MNPTKNNIEKTKRLNNMNPTKNNIEKTKRLNNTNPTKNNIEKTKIEQHEPHSNTRLPKL